MTKYVKEGSKQSLGFKKRTSPISCKIKRLKKFKEKKREICLLYIYIFNNN